MLLNGEKNFGHLTYCTNIHPGETWVEIFESLKKYLPEIKNKVSPNQLFGVGLRLSNNAAKSLKNRNNILDFENFLKDGGYYVFTLNGFPYGKFHGKRIKENAYKPDWTDIKRLTYTNNLADILSILLPEGVEGSISTVPGTYKPWVSKESKEQTTKSILENIIKHAAHLYNLRKLTGKFISLAIEPEPFCLLETIDETIDFFDQNLFSDKGISKLQYLSGLNRNASERVLRQHLGICYDICHAAVEFENPLENIKKLNHAGIKISKLQLSSAMRIPSVNNDTIKILKPMNEPIYMHQVVEKKGATLTRYKDLPDALEKIERSFDSEWRIHFHVPIFRKKMALVETTQSFLSKVLSLHSTTPISPHLEVETYTWDVLPKKFRDTDVATAISRELDWVKKQLSP